MVTPKFICGAECGIAAVGTLSAGTEHWSAAGATAVTVVTSGPSPMRSTRCFRFNPAATTCFLQHTFASAVASPATVVGRFYVYFASLPTADYPLATIQSGAVVKFVASGATIRATAGSTTAASGIAVTTGQWYLVDFKAVFDNPRTMDVMVDGVAAAQASEASAAQSAGDVFFGKSTSGTADLYIDDICISGTAADYPIGAGTVDGLYPAADGAHGGGWASGVFGKGTGGATAAAPGNTDIWQSLDNPLVLTAAGSWVSDLTGTLVTNYVEFVLDDLPADASTVNGAMVVATLHAATTTASNHSLNLANSGGSTTSLFSASFNVATITVPIVVRTTDAAGATWDVTKINDARIRFSSTDSNPDVYLDGVCLEVDYVPTVASPGPPTMQRGRNTRRQFALARGRF